MRRKLLFVTSALALMVLLGLVAYARYGNHRQTVERLLTSAFGLPLTITGTFESDVGLTTRLLAEQITLAAPAWSAAPAMAQVERLEVSVNLWSLIRGPVRVGDLRIEGARVVLEVDAEGRASWELGAHGDGAVQAPGGITPGAAVVLERAELHDVTLIYLDAARETPLEMAADEMNLRLDSSGMLNLSLSGRLNDFPLELAGRIGTLENLVAGTNVAHRLGGRVGETEFTLAGKIGNLAELGDPDLALDIHGPDLAALARTLGLPSLIPGPFHIGAQARPGAGGAAVRLDFHVGDLRAEVQGSVAALLDPRDFDLAVAASGPDLEALGALAGIKGLPGGAFEVSGTLLRNEGRTTFRQVRARGGDNTVTLDGVLGALPRMVDTDVTFAAEGPDLSSFSALARARLPAESFSVAGRLVRRQAAIGIEDLVAQVGDTRLRLTGDLGDWPTFMGTNLDLHLVCPDASVFAGLAGLDLPGTPIDLRGGLSTGKTGLVLEDVEARLGNDTLRLDGTVEATDGLAGTEVRFRLSGPDLSQVAALSGREGLPAAPYKIDGKLRVLERGYRLDAVEIRLGEATLSMDGHLGPFPALSGTNLRLRAGGPDVSLLAALAGVEGWPAEPFALRGGLRALDQGYELDAVEANVGGLELSLDGRVGPLPAGLGTEIDLEVQGKALSGLGAYLGLDRLPVEQFSLRGHVGIRSGEYRLRNLTTRLRGHVIEATGKLVPDGGLTGTDLLIQISGPALADAARLLSEAGLVDLPDLPAEPYEASGGVRISGTGYELRGVTTRLGEAMFRLNGMLGRLPGWNGTDLTIEAHGPDGGLVGAIVGVELPPGSFSVRGRVQRETSGAHFHDVRIQFGDHQARIDGVLGEPPKLIGSQLDVRAAGPSLALLSQFIDLPVNDAPFSLSGHLDGSPEQFALRDFSARLGSSDLSGSLRIDLRDKPALHGEFRSEHVDLFALLADPQADGARQASPADAAPAGEKRRLVFSEEPLRLAWLGSLDADVLWRIAEIATPFLALHAVESEAILQDGRLQVALPEAAGGQGGSLSGTITMEPRGEAYRLGVSLAAKQVRLALSSTAEDREQHVPHDVRLELSATGDSLHAMAATATGRLVVVQGEGSLGTSMLDRLRMDILSKIITALNPFADKDRRTRLECGAHVVAFEHGVAKLQPLVVATDKMRVIGRGRIDLETEKIDLAWAAKPRKGIGLSSGAITSSYIKLSGTLSTPSLTVKPLQAVASATAAFMTGGLSILAKGFWDRATSARKVCKQAIEKAGLE